MKKKRFLSMLLALALLAALLPASAVTAYAVSADSVWVNGVPLGENNPYWLNGQTGLGGGSEDDSSAYTGPVGDSSNWNAKFENGVLTLKDAVITEDSPTDTYAISADGDLELVLQGSSRIALRSSGNGIRAFGGFDGGALKISGSGTLAIEDENLDWAIYADGITMRSGTVTAEDTIYCNDLYLSGGSLTVSGAECGVDADGGTVHIDGGTLLISDAGAPGISCHTLTLERGTLEVEGDIAVYCEGDFVVTGGTAELTSGDGYGVTFDGSFRITGGRTHISGAEAAVVNLFTRSGANPFNVRVPYTPAAAFVGFLKNEGNEYIWSYTLDELAFLEEEEGFTGAVTEMTFEGAAQKSGSGSTKNTAYSDDDNVKVVVEDGDVTVKELSPGDEDYDLLLKSANGDPLMAYEIEASDGEDGARIMFFVGRENAGKQYTVLHRLPDGTIEEYHVTCAANGWITVIVDSLSPFMVFEGNVKATGTAVRVTSDDNPDTGANDFVGIATALAVMAALGCVVLKRKE